METHLDEDQLERGNKRNDKGKKKLDRVQFTHPI